MNTRPLMALVWKDLVHDAREPAHLGVMGVFSIASGVVVGQASRVTPEGGPSLLVVGVPLVLVFLSVFLAHLAFHRERESGTLDGLRMAPLDAGVVFMAKVAYSLVYILFFSMVFILSSIFFSGAVEAGWNGLISWLLPASLFFASLSSLAGAMMVYSASSGLLGPGIVLVLSIPFLQSSLGYLNIVLEGYLPPPGWWASMLGFSFGFTVLGGGLSRVILG